MAGGLRDKRTPASQYLGHPSDTIFRVCPRSTALLCFKPAQIWRLSLQWFFTSLREISWWYFSCWGNQMVSFPVGTSSWSETLNQCHIFLVVSCHHLERSYTWRKIREDQQAFHKQQTRELGDGHCGGLLLLPTVATNRMLQSLSNKLCWDHHHR